MIDIPEPLVFEWDEGNIEKNFVKHNVTNKETEEVFENTPRFIMESKKHSVAEQRFMLWGKTHQGRKLTVIFTIRGDRVRVISARDMHRTERRRYDKEKTQTHSCVQK